jgi:hypothetical protein
LSWDHSGRIFLIKFKDNISACKAKPLLENYLAYVCHQKQVELNWLDNKKQNIMSANTICVSNLSPEVTKKEVCEVFKKYGTVEQIRIEQTCAFVDFASIESVKLAIFDSENIVSFYFILDISNKLDNFFCLSKNLGRFQVKVRDTKRPVMAPIEKNLSIKAQHSKNSTIQRPNSFSMNNKGEFHVLHGQIWPHKQSQSFTKPNFSFLTDSSVNDDSKNLKRTFRSSDDSFAEEFPWPSQIKRARVLSPVRNNISTKKNKKTSKWVDKEKFKRKRAHDDRSDSKQPKELMSLNFRVNDPHRNSRDNEFSQLNKNSSNLLSKNHFNWSRIGNKEQNYFRQ